MSNANKILVGIPCGDTIKSRTVFSLLNLRCDSIEYVVRMGCDIAHNRNEIVKLAIDKGCEYVFFIDADMVFNPDILSKLLEHNKDIVSVAYNKRRLPLESVISPIDDDYTGDIPKHLFKAKSVGTGLMLIKTDVFKNLAYPYFDFSYIDCKRYGEDTNFCEKARNAGYDIWVDPTIPFL